MIGFAIGVIAVTVGSALLHGWGEQAEQEDKLLRDALLKRQQLRDDALAKREIAEETAEAAAVKKYEAARVFWSERVSTPENPRVFFIQTDGMAEDDTLDVICLEVLPTGLRLQSGAGATFTTPFEGLKVVEAKDEEENEED